MAAAEEVWQPRVFCLYCAITGDGSIESMPTFSNLLFRAVRWAARRGLREEQGFLTTRKSWKHGAPAFARKPMPTGICGGRGTYS
jgi:hypothetical protein